ncbi:MAG: MerC domain-containing protein [Balneolaceae bacterium]
MSTPTHDSKPDRSLTARLLWDRIGISLSAICTVHCLLLPVFISLLPVWPALHEVQEWAHPVLIVLLLPVTWFAARRSHFDRKISTILFIGLVLVIAGWLIGHNWLGYREELILTLAGSLFLVAGHWKNYRHHQTCSNQHHRHHPVAEELADDQPAPETPSPDEI